jgi:hypothetical protein
MSTAIPYGNTLNDRLKERQMHIPHSLTLSRAVPKLGVEKDGVLF